MLDKLLVLEEILPLLGPGMLERGRGTLKRSKRKVVHMIYTHSRYELIYTSSTHNTRMNVSNEKHLLFRNLRSVFEFDITELW